MKRIVICGAGEVGRYAAEVLSQDGHHISVVDIRPDKLSSVEEVVDVRSIKGFSCHPRTLLAAGVPSCDVLIAATNQDEINLLTAALGKRMGAAKVVARIHNRAYIDTSDLDYCKQFDIDHLICPEQLTSAAIVGNLEDPGVMAIERFAHNQIEMHRYTVVDESAAIGAKLSALDLPLGVRVAVISRDGHPFAPGGETVLHGNDIVTLIGEKRHFKQVQHMFHHRTRRANSVALMGGTSMAEWLAEDLLRRNFSIRLFERDRARAVEISEKHPKITVIQADPTDPQEFQEEHLEESAAFIAVTENDEHNILGALQAKQLGAPLTCAVIHMPTYVSLLEHLGVDWPFSPRIVAAKRLLKLVDDSPVKKLATLAPKVAIVYELTAGPGGSAVNRWLKEVTFPKGMFVAAIQRGTDVRVPGAEDRVVAGDVLIVIGHDKCQKTLTELFIR